MTLPTRQLSRQTPQHVRDYARNILLAVVAALLMLGVCLAVAKEPSAGGASQDMQLDPPPVPEADTTWAVEAARRLGVMFTDPLFPGGAPQVGHCYAMRVLTLERTLAQMQFVEQPCWEAIDEVHKRLIYNVVCFAGWCLTKEAP